MEKCAASLDKYDGPVLDHLKMLRQIASGLAYIHSQNQIHRAIKPQNILISSTGVMKVADFGHAKQTNDNGSGSWSGTQLYSSPEMIKFNSEFNKAWESSLLPPNRWGRISNKTDVFSAGLVFFYVLTGGKHPFGKGLMITNKIKTDKVADNFDGNSFNIYSKLFVLHFFLKLNRIVGRKQFGGGAQSAHPPDDCPQPSG